MKTQQAGVSAVNTSIPIPVDREAGAFNLGIVIVVSGTNTNTLQYTLENIFDPIVTPTWVNASAPFSGVTATTGGSFTIPCTAVRLNCTAYTSGFSILEVMQTKPGA